jgi:hypothetical protein
MSRSFPPTGSKPSHPRRSSSRSSNITWSVKGLLSTALLAALALLPSAANAQLQCQQFGAATFRVGSTLKFIWSDAAGGSGAESGITSFNIDLYCYESSKYMQTITTIDTTTATVSPFSYSWVVDQTILKNVDQCQFNVSCVEILGNGGVKREKEGGKGTRGIMGRGKKKCCVFVN